MFCPTQVLVDFEAQLSATHSEKEQRGLIKQLLAQAGGEEVRGSGLRVMA